MSDLWQFGIIFQCWPDTVCTSKADSKNDSLWDLCNFNTQKCMNRKPLV